jgi:hypothetical protein
MIACSIRSAEESVSTCFHFNAHSSPRRARSGRQMEQASKDGIELCGCRQQLLHLLHVRRRHLVS